MPEICIFGCSLSVNSVAEQEKVENSSLSALLCSIDLLIAKCCSLRLRSQKLEQNDNLCLPVPLVCHQLGSHGTIFPFSFTPFWQIHLCWECSVCMHVKHVIGDAVCRHMCLLFELIRHSESVPKHLRITVLSLVHSCCVVLCHSEKCWLCALIGSTAALSHKRKLLPNFLQSCQAANGD